MMNALALGLVLTSLVTAGFFTPSPEKPNNIKEDVIVKEGHRVVVVEFEKGDGNTKVSISPQDSYEKGYVKEKLEEAMEGAKEKIKEASSSVLPEAEDSVHSGEEEVHRHGFSARELVCDAYGKCKHKIASAMGKTKEAVAEKAHEAADKVYEVEEGAKEAVGDAIGKVKESVAGTAHMASDKARETKESFKDAAGEVSGKAKDKVAEKAGEMKEKAKEKVHDVIDSTTRVKEEVEREASEKTESTKEKVTEGAEKVKKEGQKEFREILRRARGVAVDVFGYVVPPGILSPVTGLLHLMGFSAAYGMCVWVTFASSYVLAAALPRHQFAMVQSKIYPVYFKAMAYSVGLALLGHLLRQRKRISPFSVGMFQGFNLLAALATILVNLVYLEPRATEVMFERMKKEKEEGSREKEGHAATTEASVGVGGVRDSTTTETGGGRGTTTTAGGTSTAMAGGKTTQEKAGGAEPQIMRLGEMLRRLNSYSSFLNILTLMSLTWHLVHLGQCLQAVC